MIIRLRTWWRTLRGRWRKPERIAKDVQKLLGDKEYSSERICEELTEKFGYTPSKMKLEKILDTLLYGGILSTYTFLDSITDPSKPVRRKRFQLRER